MSILPSTNITVSPEVFSQQVSEETVLLDLQSEGYFGLDEVGTRIWQLLQEPINLQQLFDTLLKEYDVSSELLEKDINNLLEKLLKEKLIIVDSTTE